jgi:hypothetical protein
MVLQNVYDTDFRLAMYLKEAIRVDLNWHLNARHRNAHSDQFLLGKGNGGTCFPASTSIAVVKEWGLN